MDQIKIGKYIADKRKSLGMTQAALAEELDVGDKSVSKWERGVCLPDVSKYQELCDVLGISLNELFAGEDLDDYKIIKQSEENIIGVAILGKIKNKRLSKIVIVLLICISILVAGLLWLISKEHLFMGDYIVSYSNDNPKAAALVAEYGKATLFSYSLDSKYKSMIVDVEEYRYGKLTNTSTRDVLLPEYRNRKSMFGITPELDSGIFHIDCSFDGGIAYDAVIISGKRVDDWDEWAGYSIDTIEKCKKIKSGERMLIYAYTTGRNSVTAPGSFQYIINDPAESLDSTELCYLIYVTFE